MDSGPVLGKTTTTITSAGTSSTAFADDSLSSPTTAGRSKLQDKLLPRSITGSRRWKRTGQQPGAPQQQSLTSRTGSFSLSSSADRDSPREMLRGRSHRRDAAAAAADVADEDYSGRSDDDITISSHPSQIGYLTTSSPLVQADHLQDIRTPAPASDDIDRFSRASTFHPEVSRSRSTLSRKSSSNLGSSIPSLTTSKTGLAPPTSKSKNRRTPSPAGRFRSVFKKKSPAASIASVDSQSPERSRPGDSDDANTAFPSVPDEASAPRPSIHPPSDAPTNQPDTSKVAPTERFRRLSRGQKVDTIARPETPPSTADNSPPVIVNTPPTPTEPSFLSTTTVARPQTAAPASRDPASQGFDSGGSSPSSLSNSMLAQRRSRAGSASLVPSKLSSFTLAPLTPTPENGPNTPSASGFFSTVISAAQNATNSLSNTITPWGNPGKKSATGKDQDDKSASSTTGGDDDHSQKEDHAVEVGSSLGPSLAASESADSKEPAIKTLGQGDLSLSHLGIADQPTTASGANSAAVVALTSALASSNTATMGAQSPVLGAQRVSEVSTGSRNRSDSAPADSTQFHAAPESLDQGSEGSFQAGGRPGSVSDFAGHDTPPNASIYGDKQPEQIQRTSSIRSAIGRHRNRGSSAVSGGTIAAAIAAANASLAHPAANGSTPKLTGFAVASKKRNRDFHNLFKSVPDDDYLIEDYSCALQREILAHGRIYVSEGHLCFSSNILGWVTTLVMSFDEIVSVEKRSTALVFKNGLMISTLHAKHIFASFASRDSTYDLIVKIWKLGHPSLQSSVNGVHIDETGGDKTEKIEDGDAEEASAGSRSASESEQDSDDDSNDVYDEDDEEDLNDAAQNSEPNSNGGSGGAGDTETDKVVTRKVSGPAALGGAGAGGAANGANGANLDKSKDAAVAAAGGAGGDFPGPTTHAPTDCGDSGSHYDKILADEVIPAPLGKVFSYMFGNASVTFMPKWLSSDQKCFDIQMGEKKGLGQDNKTRTFSYIKPLNAAIGPRQTKCIVTEQIDVLDFEKAIHILCSTQNPDVPNGNIFTVKTKYCLSWGEGNGTRVQMNCTTEWTGKSWIKVPIEKAANEGQAQYGRELFAGLKEALSSRSRAGTVPAKGATGGKPTGGKKSRKSKVAHAPGGVASDSDRAVASSIRKGASTKSDWGLLEPVHAILGSAVDIFQPLLTGNVMYGLLVGLLVASWFGFRGGNAGNGVDPSGPIVGGPRRPYISDRSYYPDRLAAYDEMWRREESELWDWLEERVGLDRLGRNEFPSSSAQQQQQQKKKQQFHQHKRAERNVEEKLREERMDEREIREAIRVTEEKLRVLKEVVDKREA
ncbi:gram domain-containing protein [Ophiostoma piceae UAMH 11346]|uniref:Gram domain-containing protein n=1 Tax=Ophiostoma piceae (strain UAMH 11346) TaxID=1262450 RepID=S3BS98_OPHP1|nr:gram domain-containing protein [Ophiostoma piceae UAMH 11346]